MTKKKMKIFAGSNGCELAAKIAEKLGVNLGESQLICFSEGNLFTQIKEDVSGKSVCLVQSVAHEVNDEFMELLFWIDALKRSGVKEVAVVMPYFSYAKSDKMDGFGTSIRGRVCADCLEAVGADRLITLDLHSPQVQGFFKKPLLHLSARPVFVNYLKQNFTKELKKAVIVSPDVGFEKTASLYAQDLGLSLVIGEKNRSCHDEKAEVRRMFGAKVRGRLAIIVDDFTLSGGTLAATAAKLRKMGAKEVWAMVAHNLLTAQKVNELLKENEELKYLDKLVVTDTVRAKFKKEEIKEVAREKLTEVSVAELLVGAIETN